MTTQQVMMFLAGSALSLSVISAYYAWRLRKENGEINRLRGLR